MPQIKKKPQIQKMSQCGPSKITKIRKWPKFKNVKTQELMERPKRRRREGRRSVRFALGRQSSLFCVTVLFLYLCLLWVYVFYGFYVGPAKLQRGATPPSVMVLLSSLFNQEENLCILAKMLKTKYIGTNDENLKKLPLFHPRYFWLWNFCRSLFVTPSEN